MYVTFSLTCVLRTVYLINLKNLICVDIVKCQVKFCLLVLLDFLHVILFLTILASTGGPHEISRMRPAGRGLDSTALDRYTQRCTDTLLHAYIVYTKRIKSSSSMTFQSMKSINIGLRVGKHIGRRIQ